MSLPGPIRRPAQLLNRGLHALLLKRATSDRRRPRNTSLSRRLRPPSTSLLARNLAAQHGKLLVHRASSWCRRPTSGCVVQRAPLL